MRRLPLLLLPLLALPLAAAPAPNAIVVMRTSQSAPGALDDVKRSLRPAPFDCLLAHDDLSAERLAQAKVVFFEHPQAGLLERLKPAALKALRNGLRVASDTPELIKRAWGVDPDPALTRLLLPYFQYGGPANLRAFFLAIFQESGGRLAAPIPPPEELPRQGVYHPDAPRLFPNLAEFLAWYRPSHPRQGPLAAVSFFHTYLKNGDMDFIDAQLRALERHGLAAAAVAGWPLHTLGPVFQSPPSDPLHVLLAFTLSLAKPEDTPFLESLDVHVINLLTTRDTRLQWERSERGVAASRIATALANPEAAGATDPILVAATEPTPSGMDRTVAIDERVDMAARRAARWAALRTKPNHEKRLAILYYNNPPGKGNLGASYLNLPPSLHAVLDRLRREGYSTGASLPSTDQILALLEKSGRNIESWAPGELTRMLESGGVTLLPVERYRQWFDPLPPQFKDAVNARWGPPETAKLMTWRSAEGRLFFVIPGLRLGNVFLGPQLLRASFDQYTNVQHSATLPPHHGYVASYLFYRHQLKADAVLHMGRHGTLEWLPGKNAGQAAWDASEVILGDLPNLNYYIVDGGGEAIQARRRAAAVDLSHLTPMLALAGKEDRFAPLSRALADWEATRDTSPVLAAEYARSVSAELVKTGLAKQLDLDPDAPAGFHRAAEFLASIEEAPIPLGLPVLGRMPSPDRQLAALSALIDSSLLPDERGALAPLAPAWAAALHAGTTPQPPASLSPPLAARARTLLAAAADWLSRLRSSPARELDVLPAALRAGYVPSGLVGDPLGVPAALPTGRNLHQGDPALIPTPAAWQVGKRLAQQLLDDHKRKHGRLPERISMVLWQGETGRHQGAMEAQALYLMGVEPEWNSRGVPDRLKLIPDHQLGRPRVNVVFTVSGLYRDGYPDKILLLDRAARLAASAGDNPLSRQNRQVEADLKAAGVPAAQAAAVAGARVFTTAPGAYGFGLQQVVEQSRDRDQPDLMAGLYLSKMNYVYTENNWGVQVPKLLLSQLKGNQVILHSRSSNLYGAVDNDDAYQWMGGLRVASQAAGAKPELLLNNLRRPGREKLESARHFIAAELNARNWNPRWIEEMKREGYSGAREMGKAIEYLYGWQATASETIAPEVWKKTYDVYVADQYNLGMREFFDKANPAVRQNLVARLLEVDRQGAYRFSNAERDSLVREFVRLVALHGVACSANVCGNRKLQAAAATLAAAQPASQLPAAQLNAFRRQLSQALSPKPPSPRLSPQARLSKNPTPPARLLRGLNVRFVSMAEFARRTRQAVSQNPLISLAIAAATLSAAALVALSRRRARPLVQIHLA